EELLAGNAQVGMGTFVSILLGTLIGGWLVTADQGPLYVGVLAVGFAVIGWLSSRQIPDAPSMSAESHSKLGLNPLPVTAQNYRLARENPLVFHCILGISWFWLFGGAFLTQVPNFAVVVLQGHPKLISVLLAAFIVGVAMGALLCHRFSRGNVEPGLVPLGGLGLSVFAIDLFFTSQDFQGASPAGGSLMPIQFLTMGAGIHVMLDLMFIGMFGGFLIVPLYSMIQERTSGDRRARIISVNNIFNALYMVVGAILGIVFLSLLNWTIPQFFLAIAVLNILMLGAIFYAAPEFVLRFKIWIARLLPKS
ncbi:MAG: MFS transporter, partial [Porticoccaceae bacterium]